MSELTQVSEAEYMAFLNDEELQILDTNGNEGPDGEGDLGQTAAANKDGGKGHFRYKNCDDIAILREVMTEKPGGRTAAEKWRTIFQNLSIPVKDYIAIKRRFETLLKQFKSDNAKSLRGSGTEEDYNEKMQLLTEIVSEMNDWGKDEIKPSTSKSVQDEQMKKAQKIRAAAAEGLGDQQNGDDDTTPTIKRVRQSNRDYLEILKSSEERETAQQEFQRDMERKRQEREDRELARQEANDKHRREMEAYQMKLESRRLEMEERRMKNEEDRMEYERRRSEKESEERSLLFQLLKDKM